MSASPVVARIHRVVAAAFGVLVAVNTAVLGFFLDAVVGMSAAGVFIGFGIYLLVPVLVHVSETGGVPPTTSEAVFGTGLNPAALALALHTGGLAVFFAVFVFENPLTAVGVGLGALLMVYFALAWIVAVRGSAVAAEEAPDSAGSGFNTAGVLGAGAGFVGYQGVVAVSEGAIATGSVLFVVALFLLAGGLRAGGYF